MYGSRLYVHHFHILFALGNIALGNGLGVHALLDGLLDNLVVYICEIGNIVDVIAFVLKIPSDCIKNDHRSCISNVDKIVYGRTAHIHLYLAFL